MYGDYVKVYHTQLVKISTYQWSKNGGKKGQYHDNDRQSKLRIKLMKYWIRSFKGN